MIYRIITERRDNLRELTARFFDSCTRIEASGDWKGVSEDSMIIEIDAHGADTRQEFAARVRSLAELIRTTNNQEAVLVQRIESTSVLITGEEQ